MYGKDDPFADPVLRCDSCTTIVFAEDLREHGLCLKCGNRKMRNLQVYDEDELELMKDRNVDPAFLKLFEETK